eukprot:3679669-Lingulodinium_polyedra.AAC.1
MPPVAERASNNMDRPCPWGISPWMRANIDIHHEITKLISAEVADREPHWCPLAHVSQTPGRGEVHVTGGCPAIITSTRLYSFVPGESGFLLPQEVFALQGWKGA